VVTPKLVRAWLGRRLAALMAGFAWPRESLPRSRRSRGAGCVGIVEILPFAALDDERVAAHGAEGAHGAVDARQGVLPARSKIRESGVARGAGLALVCSYGLTKHTGQRVRSGGLQPGAAHPLALSRRWKLIFDSIPTLEIRAERD